MDLLAVVAVPVLVIAGLAMRRRTAEGEHVPNETDADRAREASEFEAAERYQDEWRDEHHKELGDTRIP